MSLIGSDNLHLSVGDGGSPETFYVAKGARVSQVEINQRVTPNPAISSDAWQLSGAIARRQLTLDIDMLANDEIAALRLRTLALQGTVGNIRVMINTTETISFSAVVANYREIIAAGEIKRLQCRLESTGAVTVA